MIDLAKAVELYKDGISLVELFSKDSDVFSYTGKVQAKERPRSGKGGRMFTPPKTRKFEAEVAKWGKAQGAPCISYPIRVRLNIYESTDDKDRLAYADYIFNQKGDIDNLGKSILDGLNGVFYKDDKQICALEQTRSYAPFDGFTIYISRAGLTKLEYANFVRRMKR